MSANSAIASIDWVLGKGMLECNVVLDGSAMALSRVGGTLVGGCLLDLCQYFFVDLAPCGFGGRM